MSDLVFVLFVQLQAGREVYPFEVVIPEGHVISGVILVDQARSLSWEKRYVKMAGMAAVKLLDEVRERLAALLQIE